MREPIIFTILTDENEHVFPKWFEGAMGITFNSQILIIDCRKTQYHLINKMIRKNLSNNVVVEKAIDYKFGVFKAISVAKQKSAHSLCFCDISVHLDPQMLFELINETSINPCVVPLISNNGKISIKRADLSFSGFDVFEEELVYMNKLGAYFIPDKVWAAGHSVISSINEFPFMPDNQDTAVYDFFQSIGKAFTSYPELIFNLR